MERRIIHLNIADFSVAVERVMDSRLRTRPLIIAQPSARSLVYDMSDEAYGAGVRKGMALSLARKRCPTAHILPPRLEKYRKAMDACLQQVQPYTPLVERSSDTGHFYLDVSGVGRLFGPPQDIGLRLRRSMQKSLGLDPIWSVAPNKLLAKVASRLVKPRGEYILQEAGTSFLAPLALRILPGVSQRDQLRLAHVNIWQVGQATALSVHELSLLLGQQAHSLYRILRGIDTSPVLPGASRQQRNTWYHHFSPDSNRETVIRAALLQLVTQAGRTLRSRGLGCRQVGITVQYTDGVLVSRQGSVSQPLDEEKELQHLAATVLYRAWRRRVRLRCLSFTVGKLQHPVQQLSLLAHAPQSLAVRERDRSLSRALDAIHFRCGTDKIMRGTQLLARPSI
ncbi:hypothetical protein JWJ90_04460 [Desulfobulbus rhabdoformis]|uniref:DNA polymerase Y family protein n=1 Tax=Desulfobulbus rhabdoformis TaxID=34032 RepID=UPI00196561E7|nr:hypothetical protein [Desulfobulbus rhabdoformis]MBM9613535.1 hypothetical protein [Desulfobulbus rhabdoformis]